MYFFMYFLHISYLPHSISDCQSGKEASIKPTTATKTGTNPIILCCGTLILSWLKAFCSMDGAPFPVQYSVLKLPFWLNNCHLLTTITSNLFTPITLVIAFSSSSSRPTCQSYHKISVMIFIAPIYIFLFADTDN